VKDDERRGHIFLKMAVLVSFDANATLRPLRLRDHSMRVLAHRMKVLVLPQRTRLRMWWPANPSRKVSLDQQR
jgi:hypothetical protein